eukprot:6599838-Pyramimonas_sp.AAC.1
MPFARNVLQQNVPLIFSMRRFAYRSPAYYGTHHSEGRRPARNTSETPAVMFAWRPLGNFGASLIGS